MSESLVESALESAAEALDLEELAGQPLALLQEALGASGSALYRYDEAGRMQTIGGSLTAALATYSPDLWREDPTQREPHELAPGRRVVLPVQLVGRERFQRSDAYDAFYAPFDLGDLMCVWLTDCAHAAPGMTAMLFTRPRSAAFTARERRRTERALPSFAAAVRRDARFRRISRRARGASAVAEHASAGAYAAVDEVGRVVWAGSQAERYVSLVDGELVVPEPVAAACRELAAGRDAPLEVGFRDKEGHAVEAQLARQAAVGAPFIVGFHSDVSLAQRYALTRAEARVLAALADGGSNRDIALTLHVSVETVRTHVRRVLRKLGVPSRLQAALLVRADDARRSST